MPTLLSLAKLSDGMVRVGFQDTPALSFTILSSTSLAARVADWGGLGRATEVRPGYYQFMYQFTDIPQRFYAVRSP